MGVRIVTGAVALALAVLAAPAAAADPAEPAEPLAAADVAAPASPPDGVPHLPSPDNLPPGTTQDAPQSRTLGYLRDLFHAVRTEDVSMGDALLLFAQRPMDAKDPGQAMSPRPAAVADSPRPAAVADSPPVPAVADAP